jgi:type I restriction-modification system DNA methylase subunit
MKKKYALNKSYFKNRRPEDPSTPLEVMQYCLENGEMPYQSKFDSVTTESIYECFIEFQKRNRVQLSQYFTPPKVAKQMVDMLDNYTRSYNVPVLDMCCGYGAITYPLSYAGFCNIQAFDIDPDMIELFELQATDLHTIDTFTSDFKELLSNRQFGNSLDFYTSPNVISNPPYEIPSLTKFFELLDEILGDNVAVLLLPKGFVDKTSPSKLVGLLQNFRVLEREDAVEEFAHTKLKAEVVVLKKEIVI